MSQIGDTEGIPICVEDYTSRHVRVSFATIMVDFLDKVMIEDDNERPLEQEERAKWVLEFKICMWAMFARRRKICMGIEH